MIVVKKWTVVMIVVEKIVLVAYFWIRYKTSGSCIVDFVDTPIVIDKHVQAVTCAFIWGKRLREFEYRETGVDGFDWFGEDEYWLDWRRWRWRGFRFLAGGEVTWYGDEGSGEATSHHTLLSKETWERHHTLLSKETWELMLKFYDV
ncbi:hypothetical protein Tco_0296582 [Tanacetum coccineum]